MEYEKAEEIEEELSEFEEAYNSDPSEEDDPTNRRKAIVKPKEQEANDSTIDLLRQQREFETQREEWFRGHFAAVESQLKLWVK